MRFTKWYFYICAWFSTYYMLCYTIPKRDRHTHTDTHKHAMTAYTVLAQCHMVKLQFIYILQC